MYVRVGFIYNCDYVNYFCLIAMQREESAKFGLSSIKAQASDSFTPKRGSIPCSSNEVTYLRPFGIGVGVLLLHSRDLV